MTTNYSFSYLAGAPQKHLWRCLSVYAAELTVCTIATLKGTEIVWIFPVQSAAILLCPFILSSNQVYTYFLFHSTFLIFVKGIFTLLMSADSNLLPGFILLRMLAHIHLVVLYSLHYIQYQNRLYGYRVVDPFEPYAISRDIMIAELAIAVSSVERTETIAPLGAIAQPPADTLEGNVAPISAGRRRSNRRRR
jgi:hypothetical protein